MSTDTYPYLEASALNDLREIHRKNLKILTAQASKFGELNVPVHIKNQIDSELVAINGINQELTKRGIKTDDPLPGSDVKTVIQHYHGTVINQQVGDRGVAIGGNADGATVMTGDNNRSIRDSQGYIERAETVSQDFSRNKNAASDQPSAATLRTVMNAVQNAAYDADDDTQLQQILALVAESRKKLREAQQQLQAVDAALAEQVKQLLG